MRFNYDGMPQSAGRVTCKTCKLPLLGIYETSEFTHEFCACPDTRKTTRRDELAKAWAEGCCNGAHPAFPVPMNKVPEMLRLSFAEGYDAGVRDVIESIESNAKSGLDDRALLIAAWIRQKFGVKS